MKPSPHQPSLFDADPGPLFHGSAAVGARHEGLHLVDVRFDLRRFWRALRHDGRPMPDWDLGYAVHSALCGLFGPEAAPKPFHVQRQRPGDLTLRVLGQTADRALAARALGGGGTPWHDALAEEVRWLAMPKATAWAGQTLHFHLLARPTVRRHKVVDGREQDLELDAYQPECERAPEDQRRSRDAVYADWLRRQLRDGEVCQVADARVAGWQLAPLYRKQGPVRGQDGARRGTANVTLPQADFAGSLRVLDPAQFEALVARGIGRHRAFGYGMLLLQRAS